MFKAQLRWTVACCAALSLTLAGTARAELTDEQLGCHLRDALGFDARTLSCLGAPSNTYQLIAAEATLFCDQNRATVEPLIGAFLTAKAAAHRAYESGGEVSSADSALIEAIEELAAESGTAVSEMEGHLTTDQRTSRARVDDNRLLDPTIAILELTSEQRNDLRNAQRTRDLVLRNHCGRKSLTECASAMSAFGVAVDEVLTENQESALAAARTTMWTYLAAAQAHDESLMGE